MIKPGNILISICILIATGIYYKSEAQQGSIDEDSNIYRPYSLRMRMQDSINDAAKSSAESPEADTGISSADSLEEADSLNARLQFIKDSIAAREQFIRDSLIAREKFVRDSLARRKQILDSVTYLKKELPVLLKSTIHTLNDDLVLMSDNIQIIGDSILTDFNYIKLPNRFTDPYVPWKSKVNLSDNPAWLDIDTINWKIKSIKAPGFNNMFTYPASKKVVKVARQGMFTTKYSKKYYKAPVDSVFFDNAGRVIKVKRYYIVYQATDNYQMGALLFNFKWQVKQYQYSGSELNSFEIVKFCDRWSVSDPVKVCNIARYNVQKQGYSYMLQRTNEPENVFSDGTYKYEFDNAYNLKSVSFRNNKGSENWKTFIELNSDGNVSRYVYQDKGIVGRTLLIHYYDNPNAKFKVETITCTFEDDGISYYQRNNMTEKSRTRDRLTGEWSPWK